MQICEMCKQKIATIHITEISENYRRTQHLCDHCATIQSEKNDKPSALQEALRELRKQSSTSLPASMEEVARDMLKHLAPEVNLNNEDDCDADSQLSGTKTEGEYSESIDAADSGVYCRNCGTSLGEFLTSGRLGCPADVELFRDSLRTILTRYHSSSQYRGQTPRTCEREAMQKHQNMRKLQASLRAMIIGERYEEAAQIRDKLLQLQGESIVMNKA